ncbi:MAG: hypothetical protein QG665_393 [Patescibacteria group bacterium]|nr:hypothetical protein [Patescibacteria group bacterium]
MPITVERGGHTHPVPEGIEKLLEELLLGSGYNLDLEWLLYMGPAVKGRPEMPRIKVVRLTHHRSIEIRLRPGDNTTARVCYLRPPKNSGITLDELFMVLKGEQDRPEVNLTQIFPMPQGHGNGAEGGHLPHSTDLAEFLSDEEWLKGFLKALWPLGHLEQKMEVDQVNQTILFATELSLDERQLRQAIKKLINGGYLERVPKSHGQFVRLGPQGKKLLVPPARKPAKEKALPLPAEPGPVATEPKSEPVEVASVATTLASVEMAISQEIAGLQQKLVALEERARLIEEEARPIRERHAKLTEALHLLS